MIDKISKQVLQYLINCPDYTFSVSRGFPEHIPRHEFLSSIDFLESIGYVTTRRVSGDSQVSASLTHKGKHPREFNSIALKRYLLDKWVDILALIISVVAFIGAYRHEISEVLRIIAQAWTE